MVDSASGPYQAPGARHIVSQGVPQGGRRDGLQAAHEELLQSSIAGLGVGALRCLRPLLVDGLGVVGIHALPPRRHLGRVTGQRRVTLGVARGGHRHIDDDAGVG